MGGETASCVTVSGERQNEFWEQHTNKADGHVTNRGWVASGDVAPFYFMKPSDFKVGDRVRIATCKEYPDYDGTVGIIYHVGEEACYIDEKHKYGRPLAFRWNDCQIELVTSAIDWQAAMISNTNALSPQSPQPQTTQQKEDTVNPYAVIYQSLSAMQNATIVGYHTTEAQAKEAVETMVAGYRANLQVKQYFAVTIVNTKTGKLVGSVVDAPPAVDWAS